jgi:hypothetical protein
MWSRSAAALAALFAAQELMDGGTASGVAPLVQQAPDAGDAPVATAPADDVGEASDATDGEEAKPATVVPEPLAALTELAQLLERSDFVRADEFASALASGLAAQGGDAAVQASRAAWTAEQRAHLAYGGGLAKARSAASALALVAPDAEPDEEGARALEDAAIVWFARAASAWGEGPVRDRALAAPGGVLAWRGEREVRAAQSQAMLQPSPVPFGKETPEREALLAARATLESARAALVVRLEHDWRDVDTRANLEWVARRLLEIERILERADEQDEQQQREQQEQQQDDQQNGGEQDQQDEGQEGDQQQDGEPQDEQKNDQQQDGEQQDGEQNQDGEPREDGEQQGEPSESEDGESAEPQDTTTGERDTQAPTSESARPADADAPVMPATLGDVEVQRLLNRLAEIENEAERLRRRLRATERRRVEKDW